MFSTSKTKGAHLERLLDLLNIDLLLCKYPLLIQVECSIFHCMILKNPPIVAEAWIYDCFVIKH